MIHKFYDTDACGKIGGQEEQITGDGVVSACAAEINRIPEKAMKDLKLLAHITGHDIDALAAGWWLRISEVQTLQIELSYSKSVINTLEEQVRQLNLELVNATGKDMV